jgi:HEAT repeat protein
MRLWGTEEILATLGAEDAVRRRLAVGALVASGDLRHEERLLEMTKDPDPRVRLEAVIGLSGLGAREAFPGLLDGLRSPSAMVWGACANELRRRYGVDLGRSTEKWAAWYRKNRERLVWDAGARVWRLR